MSSARLIRITGMLLLLIGLVAPVALPAASAQEASGSLTIALVDDAGTPLSGGCFDVTDANGSTQSVCDDDGDGIAIVSDLPVGDVAVAQTSGPEGYDLAAPQSGTIAAGLETRLDFVAATIVVETPTVEPETPVATAEPTDVPTETPTEVASTPEPVDPTASAEPEETATPTPSANATEAAAPAEDAPFSLAAVGPNFGVSVSVSVGGTTLPPGASIVLGDSFTLQGSFHDFTAPPTGAAIYRIYLGLDCTNLDAVVATLPAVSVSGGFIPPVVRVAGPVGVYSAQVSFETNSPGQYPSVLSDCEAGTFSVGLGAQPIHDVTVKVTAFGQVLPDGSNITYGDGFAISDRVSGLRQSAGGGYGALSFRIYNGANCSGEELGREEAGIPFVSAQGSQLIQIDGFEQTPVGTYSFRAYYFDDFLSNPPSWSSCSTSFNIVKIQPTLSLALSSNPISVTESITGTATLNGALSPTGSVSYFRFSNATCAGGADRVMGPYSLVNGNLPQSDAVQYWDAGSYSWFAIYSGDATHESATSNCVAFSVRAPLVDLSLTANTTVLAIGDTLSYTLTIRNTGAGDALQVALTDQLPSGLIWQISSKSTGLTCQTLTSSGLLSCSVSRLRSIDTYFVAVSATVPDTACGTLNNTASVTATNHATVNSTPVTATVRCGDLVIAKTAMPATVAPGEQLEFKIVATNAGDASLSDVVVTDRLRDAIPSQIWFIDTGRSSAGCSISVSVLTCNWGTIDAGGTKTVYVSAFADSYSGCGSWTNTATGTASNEPASKSGNNSASAPIKIDCTDIAVTETAVNPVISAGDEIGFTIRVTNPSTQPAGGPVVTDTLPAGLTWRVDNNACLVQSGQLRCAIGTLAPGQSFTVTVRATTSPANCGTISNTVAVDAREEDPGKKGNNSATASVNVFCTDISASKTAVQSSVTAGDPVRFRITVSNPAPMPARTVVISDSLPAGYTWQVDDSNCSIASGALTCTYSSLAGLGAYTVTVSTTAPANFCGTISNTATVSTISERSTTLANNSATASVNVVCADLVLSKTPVQASVIAGDGFGFQITVTNPSTVTAKSVVVTDTLPAGYTWQADNTDCSIASGLLTCNFGTLAGSGATKTVTVSATSSVNACGTVSNTATVSSTTESPATLTNNTATASVNVVCVDLAITKTPVQATVTAGDVVGFRITLTNSFAATARSVVVSDTLPAGYTWQEDSPNCSIASRVLTCALGNFAGNGATMTVTVSTTAPANFCGTISNTATVSSTTESPGTLGNNTATASVSVVCADLSIAKSPVRPSVTAGDSAGFRITVTNPSTVTAKSVVVRDTLPAGFTWQADNPNCSIASRVLTCNLGTLSGNGATKTVTVSTTTPATFCGTISNTSTVSSTTESSSTLVNNTATASVKVGCPDLQVTNVAGAVTVAPGGQVTFTVTVTNIGDGDARGVKLMYSLPYGVDWMGQATGCAIYSGAAGCDFGTLAGGESRVLVLRGNAPAGMCGTLGTFAFAWADNEQPSLIMNNYVPGEVSVTCA